MTTTRPATTPLYGVEYPADKRHLIHAALNNGAPPEVHSLLKKLPEQAYETPLDVMEALRANRE
jgi:hypothetical protein